MINIVLVSASPLVALICRGALPLSIQYLD